jgi:hypothetical protein
MIFAVSFEIIIQRAVGNELCYLIKKTFSDDHYAIWHISHSFPLVKI